MFLLQPRFLLPVAAAFGFIGLAFYVASDGSAGLDSALVMLFRDPANPSLPLGPAWFREMMRDLTALGSFIGLGVATVIATLTLRLCGHRTLAFGLVLNVLSAVAASTLLKLAFGRERPDIVEHAALTFTASFPSGHAFLAAVVLLSIASFAGIASRRADIARLCLWVAWALIIAIGVSRIYLGVHWPSDVLGGWCLGIAWSSLATFVIGRMAARSEVNPARPLARHGERAV
ncbi:phosphatase PAP2 family protein [Bosea sp. (in: a-proteobacteria)]|uniref:Phosphatase PAP2 family protein n=1 Tax=Bosea vestrisii TaxID=151416 RepID=A0ABW0HLI9_9HYPH|nr:phosphatase PAP2 family protein [Bosea sp. (in: a-proteobacteria)]MBR3193432.1 phosphatase PAP2 family protein [Bosea sp. (in: a-proteobacteria)]